MAYGDENTKLENFDRIIPENVFQEVTSITTDQFRFLRDGGDYVDEETGGTEQFDGHLFDPVVFDDSVKECIQLRHRLANYFDENLREDIFDYVPPQKTNQIFTPRRVVVQMVDMLEQENPVCFDDPTHTFADLYMKSGLYITDDYQTALPQRRHARCVSGRPRTPRTPSVRHRAHRDHLPDRDPLHPRMRR